MPIQDVESAHSRCSSSVLLSIADRISSNHAGLDCFSWDAFDDIRDRTGDLDLCVFSRGGEPYYQIISKAWSSIYVIPLGLLR